MEHLLIPREWFIQTEDGLTLLLPDSLDSELLRWQIAKAYETFTISSQPKSLKDINSSFHAGYGLTASEMTEMLKAILPCRFADQLRYPSAILDNYHELNAKLLYQAITTIADYRVVGLSSGAHFWLYVPGWNDVQTREWLTMADP